MKRSKDMARKRREDTELIFRDLNVCEVNMCNNPSEETLNRYHELRQRLDSIEEAKGRKAIIRSGARWLEDGEKPTKYFLNLGVKKELDKQLSVMQLTDDQFLTDYRDILEYCADYFDEVFMSKHITPDERQEKCNAFFEVLNIPKLDDREKQSCEGPMTYDECKKALFGMMNNKSPSVSGFSKEFFAFFWEELGDLIVCYLNQAQEVGRFFVTQRRGVITLIPKKGDR